MDLGLTSGLKWAKCNLGANVPESNGLYFSWGNIDGHPAGSLYDFSEAVYDTTPGAAINTDLPLSQDAARVNLGAPWRMPTAAELQELFDNCSHIWTTLNGVEGCLFTSNRNGNTLFFPAAGHYDGTSLSDRGSFGFYWSSKYYSSANARYLRFNSSDVIPQYSGGRHFGFSIRPVLPGTPNRSVIPPTPEDEPKEEETQTTEEPKDNNER